MLLQSVVVRSSALQPVAVHCSAVASTYRKDCRLRLVLIICEKTRCSRQYHGYSSVLQCVAVCCSAVQFVAMCCSALQTGAIYFSALQ